MSHLAFHVIVPLEVFIYRFESMLLLLADAVEAFPVVCGGLIG
jgi:hypothetical protein